MFDWLTQLYSQSGLTHLIATGGMGLLIAIIFAETGIFAGFFLPGDSLLVTAGVLCALDPVHPENPPIFDFWTLGVLLSLAAIVGNCVNFWIGKAAGARVWDRRDGRFFKRRHLEEAHAFYERHGGLALAMGRFIPIVRTFVPFAAGIARMGFRQFMLWNVIGAVAWVWSMLALGHWCGQQEVLRKNLHLLILVIIAVSFLPVVIGVIKRMRGKISEGKKAKP